MKKMSSRMEKSLFALWIALCLPGILSATCSSKSNYSSPAVQLSSYKSAQHGEDCVHGFCSDEGTCECNPCWSGPTCQDYVDRFAPRFLAEEPFFIRQYSSDPPTTPLGAAERVPLFRVESADDDLGLTCQLGQVGPAATCPCATPRYSVVGPTSKMFYSDEETGDVFLRPGYTLQPRRHYFITLQVSALNVSSPGYVDWKEKVTATLYIQWSGWELVNPLLASEEPSTSGAEDGSESEETSAEDEESAEVFSSAPALIFLPEMRADSDNLDPELRYKKQSRRRAVVRSLKSLKPGAKIYFLEPSQLQSFWVGEGIRARLRLILSSQLLNVNIEISTRNSSGPYGATICFVNVTNTHEASLYDSQQLNPLFSSKGSYAVPDTVTWNLRDALLSDHGGRELDIELGLCPFQFFPADTNSQKDTAERTDGQKGRIRLEVLVSFPFGDSAERVKEVIEIPVRGNLGSVNDKEPQASFTKQANTGINGIEILGPVDDGKWNGESLQLSTVRVYVADITMTSELRVSQQRIVYPIIQDMDEVQSVELSQVDEKIVACCPLKLLREGYRLECPKPGSVSPGKCVLSSPNIQLCRGERRKTGQLSCSNIFPHHHHRLPAFLRLAQL